MTIDDRPEQSENDRILKVLRDYPGIPVVLAVNKVDLPGSRSKILPLIDRFTKKMKLRDIVPVSAKDGTNDEVLVKTLESLLPVAAPLYPDDMITDRTERFIAQELIREKVIACTDEEVPHSIAVEIEEFKSPDEYPERRDLFIRATVYVEREGQRAIILGRKGEKIKSIGTAARKALEEMTGHKTYLELWVKVNKGWRDSDKELKRLGYE